MQRKSILALVLAVIMVVAMFPMSAFAATSSGTLDSGATWEYDPTTQTLTLGGTCDGHPINDPGDVTNLPWYEAALAGGGIKIYRFGSGIGSVDNREIRYIAGPSNYGENGNDFSGVTVYSENWNTSLINYLFNNSRTFNNFYFIQDMSANDGVSDVKVTYDYNAKSFTFSGTGAMADCGNSGTPRIGWFNEIASKNNTRTITHIIIEDGITSVGNYLFYTSTTSYRLVYVESLELPNSLTSIGTNAFPYLGNKNNSENAIERVTLGSNITTIGNNAFQSSNIKAFTNLSESNQTIGSNAFQTGSYYTYTMDEIYLYSTNSNFENALSSSSNATNKPLTFIYLDDNNIENSGDLGNGVTWSYDSTTHTLSFDGNGAIGDYSNGSQPWYGVATAGGGVGSYSFGSGITGIGNGTFSYYGGNSSWGYGGNYGGVSTSAPAGLSDTITSLAPGSSSSGGDSGSGESGSGSDSTFGDENYEVDEAGDTGSTYIIVDGTTTIFKASVPIKVNVNQAADGSVSVPGTYTIDNLGPAGPIVVTNARLQMKSGWSIEAFDADTYRNMPVNSTKLGLQMNGANFATDGSLVLNSSLSSSILHAESKALTFAAKLPAHSMAVNNENIAAIIFTLDFDKVTEW